MSGENFFVASLEYLMAYKNDLLLTLSTDPQLKENSHHAYVNGKSRGLFCWFGS